MCVSQDQKAMASGRVLLHFLVLCQPWLGIVITVMAGRHSQLSCAEPPVAKPNGGRNPFGRKCVCILHN